MFPGLLEVNPSASTQWVITAAGALAIFLIVYLIDPAGIVQPESRPKVLLMDSMSLVMVFSD